MILLTGASGFIGKYLFNALTDKYGKQHVVALTSKTIPDGKYLLHHNYTFNKDYIKNNIDGNIEVIIHAGAFIPKTSNAANNIEACNSNITSTSSLLLSNLPHLQKIVFLSTVDIYKPGEFIDEESTIEPQTLYAWSKLYGEQLVSQHCNNNGISHHILRLGHIYGPGEEHFNKVIPNTIKQLLQNNTVDRYGRGLEIRSYLYVKDAVEAIVKSLNLNQNTGVINIAADEYIMITDLIDKIIKVSGMNPSITYSNKEFIGRDLKFNNSKMKQLLHIPETNLTKGLQLEWDYMKKLVL
jgi:nucleoside-diphosphate-sugar epimerase